MFIFIGVLSDSVAVITHSPSKIILWQRLLLQSQLKAIFGLSPSELKE